MFRPIDRSEDTPEATHLARLHEIGKAVNSELDLDKLLKLIMDIVIDLTGAERGFVILSQDGRDRIVVARNLDREEIRRPSFKISHSIVQSVRETGRAVLAGDAQADERLSVYSSVSDLRLRSILCVPFRLKDRVIGVLYLDHRFQTGNFTDEDLRLLEMFSDQAAIAIENARLHEENRNANRELERLNEELQSRVERREREIDEIREQLRSRERGPRHVFRYDYSRIVGRSPAMRRVFEMLDRVIDSELPVVLLGESGTGKELVARMIHENGPRSEGPFVSENCAAIPESLMESELFGFVRGAFTGADRDKPGLLELAHGGTLFLDEIGETELSFQKKLLRALQEGEFRKVGGDETVGVDVRVISATNRDLATLVDEGSFRADLYYRLKGVAIELPPLRKRREDIPLLVEHFLSHLAGGDGAAKLPLDGAVMERLCRHDWPGNVRELENEVRCMATLAEDRIDLALAESVLGRSRGGAPTSAGVEGKTLAELEREAIERALEASGGRKSRAAAMLGIPRRTFYDKLKKLGLS